MLDAVRRFVELSRKNTERLAGLVQRGVRQQISRLGVATKEDVSALRKRVRDLEGGGASPKRTAAKRTAAKRTAAKRPARKKAAAKKPAQRKTPRRGKRA
jgi:hypothetical protein